MVVELLMVYTQEIDISLIIILVIEMAGIQDEITVDNIRQENNL